MKSGLEKSILKFLHAQSLFWKIFFTSQKVGFLHQIANSVIEMTFFVHVGISMIYVHKINEYMKVEFLIHCVLIYDKKNTYKSTNNSISTVTSINLDFGTSFCLVHNIGNNVQFLLSYSKKGLHISKIERTFCITCNYFKKSIFITNVIAPDFW